MITAAAHEVDLVTVLIVVGILVGLAILFGAVRRLF